VGAVEATAVCVGSAASRHGGRGRTGLYTPRVEEAAKVRTGLTTTVVALDARRVRAAEDLSVTSSDLAGLFLRRRLTR